MQPGRSGRAARWHDSGTTSIHTPGAGGDAPIRPGTTPSRLPRGRAWTLITLALVAVAACGGSAETTTTSDGSGQSETTATSEAPTTTSDASDTTVVTETSGLDPCSLLTTGDIEAATGQGFAEGVFNDALSNAEFAICDWTATGEYSTVQVLLSSLDSYDSQRASAEEAFTVADISIPGASNAYVAEGSLVGMRVDGMFLQVSYIPPGPGDVTDATAQLAAVAVGNLR